jgi:hypothetical protein
MMNLLRASGPANMTSTWHHETSSRISALILNIAPDFSRQLHLLDQAGDVHRGDVLNDVPRLSGSVEYTSHSRDTCDIEEASTCLLLGRAWVLMLRLDT